MSGLSLRLELGLAAWTAGGAAPPDTVCDFANNIYLYNGALYGTMIDCMNAGAGSYSGPGGFDLEASQSFGVNVPRITAKGLLLESGATNLVIQSKLASGWSGENGTLTANAATAPDGTTTAATIKEDATAATNHGLFRNHSSTALSATRYVHSQYAKNTAGTRNSFLEVFDNGFASKSLAVINPANGTIVTAAVATDWTTGLAGAYAAAQSYFRLSQSFGALAETSCWIFGRMASGANQAYDGDNTSIQAVWGIQLEAAAANGYFKDHPSSLIATGAAAAGRSADVFSLNVPQGKTSATITFSDDSTKIVSVTGGGSWNVAAAVASHVATNVVAPVLQSITFA